MKTDFLYTDGLSVGYGAKVIIDNINININKGQIMTLIGPNGAGKSTILKNFTRQLSPIKGTVFIDDNDMKSMTGPELARKISMVMTSRIEPELMTCYDVVSTGRYPYTGRLGMLTKSDREKVCEALKLVQAFELSDEKFSDISDGQRQRIMLARAVCQEPELMILDEPTSYLDVKHKLEFLDILRHLVHDKNMAVIMSLHELDLAQKISDIVVCVRNNKIDKIGEPQEIFTTQYIRSLYNITKGSYNAELGCMELEPFEKPSKSINNNENKPRVMIAGTGSGSGKTTITCAILQRLVNDGYDVSSFKCGPDYIDTMFHSKIIGTRARNLDSYFCDDDTLNTVLYKNAGELSIIEGVMGFYDGAGVSGSSWQVADRTGTPVIIVIDCKGMAQSVGAVMRGFLVFKNPSHIAGFIFNRLAESMVPEIKELCKELNTKYLGRFPYVKNAVIESRHLGLVTAGEIEDIRAKLSILADEAKNNLELDEIIAIAKGAATPEFNEIKIQPVVNNNGSTADNIRIAVARDESFCFCYEDNLMLLKELGGELVEFSPLNDEELPKNISGLILYGGYPELYAKRLSENTKMRNSILNALNNGLPTIAECGGFLYLQKTLQDNDGNVYDMVGFLNSNGYKTQKLQRFGYVELESQNDNLLCKKGDILKAHEFHYWDSSDCGESFVAKKAGKNIEYPCIVANERLYAGFPHLYLYGNRRAAENFIRKCGEYEKNQG
jgi:cobyrinic acid a,c-diamide synthase